jgi:sigma-B regulation protein RsbU (phosphoserine phosphatase)
MSETDLKKLLRQLNSDKLKLNALLEITNSINTHNSVDHLIKLYEYILHEQLGINKFILCHAKNEWNVLLKIGYKGKLNTLDIKEELIRFEDITMIESSHNPTLNEFDVIVPIHHLEQPIAYLLIGNIKNEQLKLNDTLNNVSFLQTLTNIIVVAIENKRMNIESIHQERLKKELEVASEMQRLLFPADLPSNKQMDISAKYQAHHEVGGDYYDFFQVSEHEYIICIADVSGKGISAAMLMAGFQATLRTLFNYQRFNLEFLIEELNKKVIINTGGEKFITFFIAEYNAKTRELSYINAGHNRPFITNGKKIRYLDKGCVGLGMLDELPFIEKEKITLDKNSTMVLYTDGIVELENEKGEQFETTRLQRIINQFYPLKMEDLNNIIFSKLQEWSGRKRYTDDTAIFTCRFF